MASGGKEFHPLNPGILTCDLSGLPPVLISTKLFMFGRIYVVPQIFVVAEKSQCACWPRVNLCLCVAGSERQGGVLSLCSFGLEEGSRGSGEERERERSASATQ